MIRPRDQVRLCLQKLRLRKRRAFFSILLVAIGVIAPVTMSSLFEGLRTLVTQTMATEELHSSLIKVHANDNPYFYTLSEEERAQAEKKRFKFLDTAALAEFRSWPAVEAAEKPVAVGAAGLDILADTPNPRSHLTGLPLPLLQRYVQTNPAPDTIPLVLGERLLRTKWNAETKKLEKVPRVNPADWLGKPVTIQLGDNYGFVSRFEWKPERKEYARRSDDEIATERERMQRTSAARYDRVVFDTVLPLRAQIAGVCPGNEIYVPSDVAERCRLWIEKRNQLAAHVSTTAEEEPFYEARGRRTPREGEFTEAWVVVKDAGDTEKIAKQIEKLGFYPVTRERTFESQSRMFENAVRVVRNVVYAIGGVILGLAGALLWSTTSKIVSDSRVDIGLFRALGATKGDIRRLFLSDTVVLGVFGTVTGVVLGWLLAAGISRWVVHLARAEMTDPDELVALPATIFAWNGLFCLKLTVIAAALAFLAGLWPATRAANIDPVRALKRE